MLQFIFGRASSGKSETVYNLASKDNKDNTVIIVPEQYSFETERNLLKKDISGISVLNFTRLVDVIKNQYGGTAGDTLSSFDKVIVMLRALNNVKDELILYKKYYDSIDFANKLISLSNELKESAVSLSSLDAIIDDIKISTTKAKIKDLLTIYLEYDSIVQAEFLDPADDLQRLYDAINANEYFKDKNVYFDGFKGFTNAQLKIIKCALRDANKVVISLCCDTKDYKQRNIDLFYNIYSVIDTIESIAKSVNCNITEPLLLDVSYFDNAELKHFEKNIFNFKKSIYDNETNNIFLMHSNTSSEMIDDVLITIHRLVRTLDYQYGDFVIIARDINKYDKYLSSISEKYNIPIYFDKRKSLKYSPISRFVISAFDAALCLKTDKIFEYLKCGLEIISESELSTIQDYVELWKIDGDKWLNDWTMSVKGLNTYDDDQDKEKCLQKLDRINDIRKKIIEPICSLKKDIGDIPANNCQSIYNFIKNNKVADKLNDYIKNLEKVGNFKEADYCKASYEPFMDVLSSLHKCFKNYSVNPKKFLELFVNSISNKTVGTIPQMCDEVSCGSADRIRPARPKIAFIIGLNQYEFPQSISENDLLLSTDRQALIDLKIDIIDKLTTYLHNENFLIYSTSCCASEKVFLCSCSNMGDNMPSIFVSGVKDIFPKIKTVDYSNLESKIETAENAFSILAQLDSKTSIKHKSLYEYYSNTEYKDKLEYLEKSLELNNAKLNDQFALKHFDHDINMSASRVDCFYKCKFNYFCKYILRLRQNRPAEIDVANRGTIVHYVLEKSIGKYSKGLANMDKKQLDDIVDFYLDEYLQMMEATELLNDSRFKFIFNKISNLTKKTIYRISDEFKFTEFEPISCECEIGGEIPALVINGKNKITITGSIDRVDLYDADKKYIRVVDYKSGNIKININNLLYGLNLQMLIYLYAFIKNNNKFIAHPAGVFYLPVNGGYNKENPKMRMNGILPNDPSLYLALDKSGEYVPNFAKDVGRKDNPQIDPDDFYDVFDFLEYKVKEMENSILSGDFEVSPVGTGQGGACQYCDFKSICRLESNDKVKSVNTHLDTTEVIKILKGKSYEI